MTRAIPVPCRARIHAFILTVGMGMLLSQSAWPISDPRVPDPDRPNAYDLIKRPGNDQVEITDKQVNRAGEREMEQQAVLEGTHRLPSSYEFERVKRYFDNPRLLLLDIAMTRGYENPERWGESPGEWLRVLSKALPDVGVGVGWIGIGFGSSLRGGLELYAESIEEHDRRAILTLMQNNVGGIYGIARDATIIEIEVDREIRLRQMMNGPLKAHPAKMDVGRSFTQVKGSSAGHERTQAIAAIRKEGMFGWMGRSDLRAIRPGGVHDWHGLHGALARIEEAQAHGEADTEEVRTLIAKVVQIQQQQVATLRKEQEKAKESLAQDDVAYYVHGKSWEDIRRGHTRDRAQHRLQQAKQRLALLDPNADEAQREQLNTEVKNAKALIKGIRKDQTRTDALRTWAKIQAYTHAAVAVSRLIPDRDIQEGVWMMSEAVNIGGQVAMAVSAGFHPAQIASVAGSMNRLIQWYRGDPSQEQLVSWSLEAIGEGINLLRRDVAQVEQQVGLLHHDFRAFAYHTRMALSNVQGNQVKIRQEAREQYENIEARVAAAELEIEATWSQAFAKNSALEAKAMLNLVRNWRQRPLSREVTACLLEQECTDDASDEIEKYYAKMQELAERFMEEYERRGRDFRTLTGTEAKATLQMPVEQRNVDMGTVVSWLLQQSGLASDDERIVWPSDAKGTPGADQRSLRWLTLYMAFAHLMPIRTTEGEIIADGNVARMCSAANGMQARRDRLVAVRDLATSVYVSKLSEVRSAMLHKMNRLENDAYKKFGALLRGRKVLETPPDAIRHAAESTLRHAGFFDEVSGPPSNGGKCIREERVEDPEACDTEQWMKDEGELSDGAKATYGFLGPLTFGVTWVIGYIHGKVKKKRVKKEQQLRQSCPRKYKRFKQVCKWSAVGDKDLAIAALKSTQQSEWEHALGSITEAMRRDLTLARLALDTVMRETLGRALGHNEDYAAVRRALATMPDGHGRWTLHGTTRADPATAFRWLRETMTERMPDGNDPVQTVRLLAKWSEGEAPDQRRLGDYVSRAQLPQCETDVEGEARRANAETQRRIELAEWSEKEKEDATHETPTAVETTHEPPRLTIVRVAEASGRTSSSESMGSPVIVETPGTAGLPSIGLPTVMQMLNMDANKEQTANWPGRNGTPRASAQLFTSAAAMPSAKTVTEKHKDGQEAGMQRIASARAQWQLEHLMREVSGGNTHRNQSKVVDCMPEWVWMTMERPQNHASQGRLGTEFHGPEVDPNALGIVYEEKEPRKRVRCTTMGGAAPTLAGHWRMHRAPTWAEWTESAPEGGRLPQVVHFADVQNVNVAREDQERVRKTSANAVARAETNHEKAQQPAEVMENSVGAKQAASVADEAERLRTRAETDATGSSDGAQEKTLLSRVILKVETWWGDDSDEAGEPEIPRAAEAHAHAKTSGRTDSKDQGDRLERRVIQATKDGVAQHPRNEAAVAVSTLADVSDRTALAACRDGRMKKWTRIVLKHMPSPSGLEGEPTILEYARECDALRNAVRRYHWTTDADTRRVEDDSWWLTLAQATGNAYATPKSAGPACRIVRSQWADTTTRGWRRREGAATVRLPLPEGKDSPAVDDPLEQIRAILVQSQSQPDLRVPGQCLTRRTATLVPVDKSAHPIRTVGGEAHSRGAEMFSTHPVSTAFVNRWD